jgi:hypothetical protein
MRKKSKSLWQKAQVVRITYEPDYDHEVWEHAGEAPTPATDPDAFYARRELAYPLPNKSSSRKSPHKRLSKRALRKRLYQAGVRDEQLTKLVSEILAGPPISDPSMSTATVALGWNVEAFRTRFGKRIARAVLRFVASHLVVLDEAVSLFNSSAGSAFIQEAMQRYRKFNLVPLKITQSVSQL